MHLFLCVARRILAPIVLLAFVVLLPSIASRDFSVLPQAEASSRNVLVYKCRKAVFAKYGQRTMNSGRKVRSLPFSFSTSAIDACVANGGRVI
jgi:hypothetical protein